MRKAEEIVKRWGFHFEDAAKAAALNSVNEVLEWAAQQANDEADSIITCLNPTSAVNACRYVAERIRAGKSR